MAEMALDRVDILMVDPDRNAQSVLRTILGNSGFRNFQTGRSIEEMRNRVDETIPDLLISECELPDGDFCDFVYSLRHHDLGRNPFVSIIALTQAPSPDMVTRISNSGVDHLVVKPFSTAQVVDRIMTLMKSRKLFVVTSDYIGPDRRRNSNRESKINRIAVPNTLKAKALGTATPEDIQRAIDLTLAEINIQKLERYDDEIGYLVDRIVPALANGRPDTEATSYLERLLYVAGDTGRRLTGTKYAHVSELCEALLTVSDSVYASLGRPDPRDIQLLRPLSQAIRIGFGTNEKTVAAAHEISIKALERFRRAQAEKSPHTPRRRSTDTVEAEAPPSPSGKTAVWIATPESEEIPASPVAADPVSEATEGVAATAKPGTSVQDFNTSFARSLCAFLHDRLTPWHVESRKQAPLPFALSASFATCFEEAVRLHIANAIPRTRRMVVLAQNLNPNESSDAVFRSLFDEPNPRDNVPRFLWNSWWDEIRNALSGQADQNPNAPFREDAKQIWHFLQAGAADGNYDPPQLQDIAFFKSLFDFTTTGIHNGKTGLQQVLQHEASGEAQEGASRNFMLAQIENQPPYLGDLLALWAYFTRKDFTPAIQKSFIASTGRTLSERRLVLPFYLRWAPDLTRRNDTK